MVGRFFDSHAHLDGEAFDKDLPEVLARAREVGVTDIVCIGSGYGFGSNAETLRIVDAYPGLHATFGIHPHNAVEYTPEVDGALREMLQHPKAIAVGEIGLDYHYDLSPRDAQETVFRKMIRLAHQSNKPIVVHTREAEDDTFRILDEEDAWWLSGVLHCYTSSEALALAAVERGFYISFSGILTFNNAEALRRLAQKLPRNRVLIETDSPFLAPVPLRGRRNEPAYVGHVAACLAEQWGEPEWAVRQQTSENCQRLFNLD